MIESKRERVQTARYAVQTMKPHIHESPQCQLPETTSEILHNSSKEPSKPSFPFPVFAMQLPVAFKNRLLRIRISGSPFVFDTWYIWRNFRGLIYICLDTWILPHTHKRSLRHSNCTWKDVGSETSPSSDTAMARPVILTLHETKRNGKTTQGLSSKQCSHSFGFSDLHSRQNLSN